MKQLKSLLTIKNKLIAIAVLVTVGMLGLMSMDMYSKNVTNELQEIRVLSVEIEAGMLMLRRNEKDFLARTNLKYQKKFNANIAKTIAKVDQLIKGLEVSGLKTKEATQTRSVLQTYGVKFNEMVNVVVEMGLDPKSGLYGALRNAVHDVEDKVKSLNNQLLLADTLMLRRREKDFMLRWDMKYLDKFNKDFDKFVNHLNASDVAAKDKTVIVELMQTYQNRFGGFVEGAQKKGLNSKSGILGEMRKTVHQTETLLKNLHEQLEKNVADKQSQLLTITSLIVIILLTLVIASVVIVALSIIRPVNRLRETMHNVSVTKNLKIRSDIKGYDEIAQMSDAFNEMIAVFDRSINEVFHSTIMLSTASEELSMITQNTRDGVQRQQTETEQVATAMNEMTATVQEVARSASEAAAASRIADGQSNKGRQVVNETISGIKSLATKVQSTASEISELKSETDNINTVLQVIGGIAEQTNLLALNAAIEAARAGEQGRGFAVVADEVRTLASRSQESTQEISEIIERLQHRASTAVAAMEESRELANGCVEQADIASESLNEITSAVSSINEKNLEIASAAEEQSSVADEINRNIVNINDVAIESTSAANETLKTSKSLAELSTELQTIVNQFEIDESSNRISK